MNEAVRDVVRAELRGGSVKLAADRYAQFTCDGAALSYVELDGKDYGEELLRRGPARMHPKHKHMRYGKYEKAEGEARKAGTGCWAK
ncbi:MAG: thermonuclease family protein [Planctomycetota bacterium]